ncbi:type III pantothenate kinase [Aestuariibacter halophilus]|uniref:Type III pantothenate kinase n=1 Tax=Fluctibacter halophilus TaxID=226011 RepID=A0ABS8GCN5_9ALTE|nr:type III pantothenate kinase [Aestuariibacter halophilus]MCC2618325.1 type III pantothenate kinase [Aestuariibacter halophilus]
MSAGNKTLLIDIGNSRLKVAWASDENFHTDIMTLTNADPLLPLIQQACSVWVASVGKAAWLTTIEQQCDRFKVPLHVATNQMATDRIQCAYVDNSTLGVDRWLGVIAARALTALPVVVIDVGTAITCDFVQEDRHLGGWIGPGYSLMRDSLTQNTERVFADEHFPEELGVGISTPECVSQGCLSLLQGMVLNACQQLASRCEQYCVIVSGGGKSLLASMPVAEMMLVDNVVLVGLSVLSHNKQP